LIIRKLLVKMSNKIIILILGTLSILIIFSLMISSEFANWVALHSLDILIAAILAVIFILVIQTLYKRLKKPEVLKTTITPSSKPEEFQARLILKENQEFLIKEYEQIFGREDFLGVLESENLAFIGKEHFKITKNKNGFYIEDLETKNGTLLNKIEIKGAGPKKLKNKDKILVAKTLRLRYLEKI
jgi:hypothetical protein